MFTSLCFLLKFFVFFTYAIIEILLSFLAPCSCSGLCPHFAEIHPEFVVPLQPNSFFRLVCPAVLFSVLFPAVGMELFYIYRMWKIKQACKKYSSVVHSTKIYLCLFTLDVWVYAETNWLQKYRTDDQKCG